MVSTDFFRARLDAMIDLRHPLAVLASRLPWPAIEATLGPKLSREAKAPKLEQGKDLLGV